MAYVFRRPFDYAIHARRVLFSPSAISGDGGISIAGAAGAGGVGTVTISGDALISLISSLGSGASGTWALAEGLRW